MAQGISVIHLYATQLKTLKIAIPKIAEQQKIAACLSSLDELIAAHSDKLEALKQHKKGLMQQLFPAEGETVPKLRFAGFGGEAWEEKKLEQLAFVERGKFSVRPRNDPKYFGGNIPFVQTGDIAVSGVYLKRYTQTLNEKGLSAHDYPQVA